MDRKKNRRIKSIALGVALVFLGTIGDGAGSDDQKTSSSDPTRRLNVLLLVIDTLRADHLEAYGYPHQTLPAATRLAKEGALFRNAIAQSSWTGASMASLLSGTYPSTHGFVENNTTGGQTSSLSDDLTTLAECLANAGYETIGHVTNVFLNRSLGMGQGFAKYIEYPHATLAETVTTAALEDLRRFHETRERPFFLYAHFMEPHAPYRPPSEYALSSKPKTPRLLPADFKLLPQIDLGSRDLSVYHTSYDGEIRYVGDQISRILDRLASWSLLDETLVILTSDHGEELFDRGAFGHGHTLHEELLRVPLILRFPPKIIAGAEIEPIVELIDVLPTIAELIGIDPPTEVQGKSFANVLRGKDAPDRDERIAFSELHIKGPIQIAARARSWKATCILLDRPILFAYYDLENDPEAKRNIGPSLSEQQRKEIERSLANWHADKVRAGARFTKNKRTLSEEDLRRLKALGYLEDR